MFRHTTFCFLFSYTFGSYHCSDIASLLLHMPTTLEKKTALQTCTALLTQCEISVQVWPKRNSPAWNLHQVIGGRNKETFQIINHPLSASLQKYDCFIATSKGLNTFLCHKKDHHGSHIILSFLKLLNATLLYKHFLEQDNQNHMLQMEKQAPLSAFYAIDWINRGSLVCANCCQTKTPTIGGKVSVKLSSPESRSHNTPLRHGRLVWNIPESSQPPSQLIWMSALTSEMGRLCSHLCHLPPSYIHVYIHSFIIQTMNIYFVCKWHLLCDQKDLFM